MPASLRVCLIICLPFRLTSLPLWVPFYVCQYVCLSVSLFLFYACLNWRNDRSQRIWHLRIVGGGLEEERRVNANLLLRQIFIVVYCSVLHLLRRVLSEQTRHRRDPDGVVRPAGHHLQRDNTWNVLETEDSQLAVESHFEALDPRVWAEDAKQLRLFQVPDGYIHGVNDSSSGVPRETDFSADSGVEPRMTRDFQKVRTQLSSWLPDTQPTAVS